MSKLQLLFYSIYSLYVCIRYLPFKQAIKIPIFIHPSVRVRIDRTSSFVFSNRIWRSMLSFGFDASAGRSNCQSLLYLKNGGQLVIKGQTVISKGSRLIVDGGKMEIGHHFFCNGDCFFNCTTSIEIGSYNMYGWNVHFNTTDGHPYIVDGKQKKMSKDIKVGNHVWIASNTQIAKGTQIASDCVVAQCSLVNGHFYEEHCLIGGIPARLIKKDVSWSAK